MTIKPKRGLPPEQTAWLPASVENYVGTARMVRVIDAGVERLYPYGYPQRIAAQMAAQAAQPATTCNWRWPKAASSSLRTRSPGSRSRARPSRASPTTPTSSLP